MHIEHFFHLAIFLPSRKAQEGHQQGSKKKSHYRIALKCSNFSLVRTTLRCWLHQKLETKIKFLKRMKVDRFFTYLTEPNPGFGEQWDFCHQPVCMSAQRHPPLITLHCGDVSVHQLLWGDNNTNH